MKQFVLQKISLLIIIVSIIVGMMVSPFILDWWIVTNVPDYDGSIGTIGNQYIVKGAYLDDNRVYTDYGELTINTTSMKDQLGYKKCDHEVFDVVTYMVYMSGGIFQTAEINLKREIC